MKPIGQNVSAAQAASMLGLTVRALRLYERHGLLKPLRTSTGWRVYGPEEFARLHQVLALKRLGLPLKRIGELLRGGAVDLDQLLALQEQALVQQQARVDGALKLVRSARARLARGEALPTDQLVQLIKETAMSDEFQWTEAHETLARQHFTPEQMEQLKTRKFDIADQQRTKETWDALIAEAERLRAIGDPASPEAIDLARRWNAEVAKFTGGDPGLQQASCSMYRGAFEDPSRAPLMPFSKEVWEFVGEAARRGRA